MRRIWFISLDPRFQILFKTYVRVHSDGTGIESVGVLLHRTTLRFHIHDDLDDASKYRLIPYQFDFFTQVDDVLQWWFFRQLDYYGFVWLLFNLHWSLYYWLLLDYWLGVALCFFRFFPYLLLTAQSLFSHLHWHRVIHLLHLFSLLLPQLFS